MKEVDSSRGWTFVGSKKKIRDKGGRWDFSNQGRSAFSRKISSFYVTSFPEKVCAKELYDIFEQYGEVDEVIIPNRRNKHDHRFGFARFFDFVDELLLATKLDNIFVGNQKLFVNVPRFHRRLKEVETKPRQGGREMNIQQS